MQPTNNPMWLGIDGTNWIHQLWHAMQSRPELVVDAAARRLAAIVDWIEDPERKPRAECSQILVCFDRRSFRWELSAEYKANRPPKAEGLVETLALAERLLGQDVATVAAVDGYEADDLLATFARIGAESGAHVILASPDKDLRQCLVSGVVSILSGCSVQRGRMVSPDWWYTSRLAQECGVRPQQWPDYQALVGERGDNVQGCPGVGPVAARKMLETCGSLAEILRNPWACPCTKSQRTALFSWKNKADLALQLVTLRTDVQELYDWLR